jgi:hypothetical protein
MLSIPQIIFIKNSLLILFKKNITNKIINNNLKNKISMMIKCFKKHFAVTLLTKIWRTS